MLLDHHVVEERGVGGERLRRVEGHGGVLLEDHDVPGRAGEGRGHVARLVVLLERLAGVGEHPHLESDGLARKGRDALRQVGHVAPEGEAVAHEEDAERTAAAGAAGSPCAARAARATPAGTAGASDTAGPPRGRAQWSASDCPCNSS